MIGVIGYDTEERKALRAPEPIVAMCCYDGRLYVATQWHVYRLLHLADGNLLVPIEFEPLPPIKRPDE